MRSTGQSRSRIAVSFGRIRGVALLTRGEFADHLGIVRQPVRRARRRSRRPGSVLTTGGER